MPRKARDGRTRTTILRCIGCNVCIAHYHAETPIRCAQNPRTGPRADAPARRAGVPIPRARRRGRRRAGRPRRRRRGRGAAGNDVIVLERRRRDRRAGLARGPRRPRTASWPTRCSRTTSTLLDRRERRAAARRRAPTPTTRRRRSSPTSSSSRRARGPSSLRTALDGHRGRAGLGHPRGRAPGRPRRDRDWGGDAAALDCAELLAEEGCDGHARRSAPCMPGETLHQYVRNSYLGRLQPRRRDDRALPRPALGGTRGAVRFRNIFAPELETRDRGRRARALARPRAERRPRRASCAGTGCAFTRRATAVAARRSRRRSSRARWRRAPSSPRRRW